MQETSEDLSRYQRRKQRTREALKDTAAALLMEKGYEALTIQDITDRLDLARATFYVHFKDKDDVIWSLLQNYFDEFNARLLAELPTETEGRHYQKLLHGFSYVTERKALLQVMLSERGHIKLMRRFARYMAAFIQNDIESGLSPRNEAVSTEFTAQFMAGAMIQVLTWWLESGSDLTPVQLTDMFYALESR